MPRLFDPTAYGPEIEHILSLDSGGARLLPLAITGCCSEPARSAIKSKRASELFPKAAHAKAALAGLYLYFSCFDESHDISQDIGDQTGSYWHGILHRQEPDAGNASYWFHRVGQHPVFDALHAEAAGIVSAHEIPAFKLKSEWDPFAFIDFCELARARPGSPEEQLAREIQRAEWQLLFDYCARPRT